MPPLYKDNTLVFTMSQQTPAIHHGKLNNHNNLKKKKIH